ncbi:cell envelope integrity protein TolA [Rhizobium sp. L1K21]|uniref:cell envelope integrity protein TolA n=1 Tax=Rhizobium sp. L1K21 TaxID=2954933 RepID=UPI0020924699|nr:cell envelope integrity protein TolA [Rhizobium sp. L1K21]MCO6185104.1 hypothetical protein [Rhizobium sp. L1K21]
MKGSLLTSTAIHAIVLALALYSFGAPPAFEVQDVESLPVDIVPIEDMTRIMEGEKKATAKETPAPTPTKRPDIVPDAQNTGENSVDLKKTPVPTKSPKEVEIAAAPEKVESPVPKNADKANDIKDIIKDSAESAPATEVAAKPEPKRDVKPDPVPEAKAEQTAKAEDIPLPDAVPLPSSRPDQPKPEPEQKQAKNETAAAQAATAKTPERKKEQPKKESAKSTASKESDVLADEVAALLNKQDPAGGGAKRSTKEESLGGSKASNASKLSQSELDALRGAIQKNWSVVSGMADAGEIRIQVKMKLDRSGEIVGDPEVTATGGSAQARDVLASSARRAVLRSAPFSNLPADKYDAWSEVIVNFDPSELML